METKSIIYSKTVLGLTIEGTERRLTVILAGKITDSELGFKFAKRALIQPIDFNGDLHEKIYCKMPIRDSYKYYKKIQYPCLDASVESLVEQELPQDTRNLLFDAIMASCSTKDIARAKIKPDYHFKVVEHLDVSEEEMNELDDAFGK